VTIRLLRWPAQTATLASVFLYSKAAESWHRIPADDPHFSQLHSNFWGKPIATDTPESHGTPHGGEPMNLDGTEIGPGCFTLDLGVDSWGSILWVRQDYLRLYNFCEMYSNKGETLGGKARSVVITGHPGVGECSALSTAYV
jgi:hypothetical protein